MEYIAGIDEVGRGSIAGPVAVGLVIAKSGYDFSSIKDSKKLTPKKREEWHAKLKMDLNCMVAFESAKYIDKFGITKAIKSATEKLLKNIDPSIKIIADYGIQIPDIYSYESHIKADETFPVVSAASIFAKVERDRYMSEISEKYPEYFFESNKGYGTKNHTDAIHKSGTCNIHRISFLSGVLSK